MTGALTIILRVNAAGVNKGAAASELGGSIEPGKRLWHLETEQMIFI